MAPATHAPARSDDSQSNQGWQQPVLPPSNSTNVTIPTSSSLCCIDVKAPVLLQTACMMVHNLGNPDNSKEVWLILDTRSQRSYITESVMEHLSLIPVSSETMIIKTFGVKSHGRQACDVVKVGMSLKNGHSLEMSFLFVPLICEPISNQPTTFVCSNNSQFASLELADCCHENESLEVDILVGADQYYQLVTGEIIHERNGLTAIHTRLEWVLSGPVYGMSQSTTSANLVMTHALSVDVYQPQESLEHRLKQFWDLESMGIQPQECSVYDKFERGIVYDGERYQVSIMNLP